MEYVSGINIEKTFVTLSI